MRTTERFYSESDFKLVGPISMTYPKIRTLVAPESKNRSCALLGTSNKSDSKRRHSGHTKFGHTRCVRYTTHGPPLDKVWLARVTEGSKVSKSYLLTIAFQSSRSPTRSFITRVGHGTFENR